MTAYSGVIPRSPKTTGIPAAIGSLGIGKNELAEVRIQNRSFYRLNLVLLVSVILMAFAYIFSANFVVAQKYGLNLRKNELNALNAQAGSLNNEYQSDQDLEVLLLFAKRSGMVEAKDIESILQDRNFALNHRNTEGSGDSEENGF